MKLKFKKMMFAALISTAAASTFAFAHGGGDGGCGMHGEGGPGMMAGAPNPEKMKAHMSARLDKLNKTLSLRADQASAWESYKATLLNQADARMAEMQKMRSATPPATVLERMNMHEEMAKAHQAGFATVRTATETFYGTLDTAQKAQFDKNFHLPMEGRGGRHGGPRGGRGNDHEHGHDDMMSGKNAPTAQ